MIHKVFATLCVVVGLVYVLTNKVVASEDIGAIWFMLAAHRLFIGGLYQRDRS